MFVIMNSDSGDWWSILCRYQERLEAHLRFDYQPWRRFRERELSELGVANAVPFSYEIAFESPGEMATFMFRDLLWIRDEALWPKYASEFETLADQFIKENGEPRLDVDAEIVVVGSNRVRGAG